MSTSFFIIAIGCLPIVLALNVLKMYKGSPLAIALLLFMISISLWQLDVSVLYLEGILPEEAIFWLFRLLRIGVIAGVPIAFYTAYLILKKHTVPFKKHSLLGFLLSIFNKKALWLLMAWSVFIYVINWSNWGIKEIELTEASKLGTKLYFPIYGELHFLFLIHTGSIFFLLLVVLFVTKTIPNQYLRSFLTTFSLCAIFLFLTGYLNFIPATGAILGSMGVVVFSSIIVFAFVKMNTLMTINYNRLVERQKKLDYTGDIATSLIHEVKNNLQIIKAYSKLLPRSSPLPEESRRMVNMIEKASNQLEELTQSYSEYLHTKAIDFKITDVSKIIQEAIDITSNLVENNRVELIFENKCTPLKAYVSETYLKQVFVNLIKNSCEAIDDENKQRRITIRSLIVDDQIIIDVIDTGDGIPLDQWEYIFDPFISTKKSGMGAGLPFVRKIIFEHRGEIKVSQSSEKGTTFRMILPQYEHSYFQ
ncbi:sensor histidine kinase [Bacillus suaedae]|uniref:histidine kinase n=1 Tax=Halalkalibacter suaedae TaxID=2822140 RepID=A0A940WVG7_9BACI|nr:HAMP domain-containing sensor histidine kinase [Bacillus suaedae]MBP3951063.1 HAMP domain-containing histidine kinase [Bacillus suaedae]